MDAEAGVIWQFSRNVGVDASYRFLDYGLDVADTDLVGSVDYTLSGPTAFITFDL